MNTVAELQLQNQELKAALAAKEEELKIAFAKLEYLELKLFGPSSEKVVGNLPDGQLALFHLDEDAVAEPEQEIEPKPPRPTERKSKPTGRKPLPKELPRVTRVLDLEPEEKQCCGQSMATLGEDVREVLECLPAVFFVVQTILPKYVCQVCHGQNGCHGAVAQAEPATQLLPKSSAGNTVLAEIVVNKIADGLPAYRQSKRFRRFDLKISRRTVVNWLSSVAKHCHVLDKLLLEDVVSEPALQMDETYFQVLGEDGRANQTKSYMWVMRSLNPDRPVIYYVYSPTRAAKVPRDLLDGFQGIVQTDGYKGYDFLENTTGVSLAACWSHVRRKFVTQTKGARRKKKNRSKTKTFAENAVSRIQELYAIERKAKEQGLHVDAIRERRNLEARPILDDMKQWFLDHIADFPASSPTRNAIAYALRLWDRLTLYLDHGHIPIDNNGVENIIRPFVIGRKNSYDPMSIFLRTDPFLQFRSDALLLLRDT